VPRNRLTAGLRRTLRLLLRAGLAVVVLAVAAVLLLLLAPVRGRLLPAVLTRVDAALPGSLAWERAAWPALGRLELDGVLWTVDADTLLHAPALRLEVELRPLLSRDVVVRDAEVRILRADIAGIRTALAPVAPADAEKSAGASGGFPRPGALPGVPSVALLWARLDVARVDLDAGSRIDGALLHAAGDLRAGHEPFLDVDTLRVAAAPGGWTVPQGFLALRPDDVRARLRAVSAAGDTVALAVTRAAGDSFRVEARTAGAVAADVRGEGVLGRDPVRFGLRLHGEVDGRPVDRVVLGLRGEGTDADPWTATVAGAALGWRVATDAVIRRDDALRMDLAPVVILREESVTPPRDGAARGSVVVADGRIDATGLRLQGDLGDWRLDAARDGDRVRLTAAADLPGPARFAAFAPAFRMDDWTTLALDLRAAADLGGDEPAWTAALDLGRTPWLAVGRAGLHGRGARAEIDSLRLAVSDVTLRARGRAAPNDLALELWADLGGADLLRRAAEIPADLRPEAHVRATLAGAPEALRVDGTVRARFRTDAWDVGLALAAGADVTPERIAADLGPVAVIENGLPAVPGGPRDGRAVLRGEDLRLDGLRLTGDLGEARLDVRRDPVSLAADLAAAWPELPPALARRLGDRAPAWRPTDAEVHASFAAEAGVPTRGRIVADLDLPGPAAFAALTPDARLDDLVGLRAALVAEVDLKDAEPAWTADLDLAATPWLEAGRARARGRGAAAVLDTLLFALPGLRVNGAGVVAADSLDLAATIAVPDQRFVARFAPLAPWADLELALDLHAAGSPAAPRVAGALAGRASTPQFEIPRLTGALAYAPNSTHAVLEAPDGVAVGLLTFDAVRAAWSAVDPAAGGGFRLSAAGDLLALELAGDVAPAPVLELSALDLRSDGRDLSLARPFRVERAGEGWRVEPLELRGGLGTVRGGGAASPDSLDLVLVADVGLPLRLVRALAPGAVLPSDRALETLALTADLALSGSVHAPRLAGNLGVAVRDDAGADDLALAAALAATPGMLGADLALSLRGHTLATGDARLPAAVSLDPPSFVPSTADSFRATLRTRTVDLAALAAYAPPGLKARGTLSALADVRGVGRDAVLRGFLNVPEVRVDLADGSWLVSGGRVDLSGPTARPALDGRLTVRRGVLKIPDVPPPLLPAQGRALLLDQPLAGAPADTVTQAAPAPVAAAPPALDMDLRLVCPGDLWLRGRGLSLQLRGDLQTTLRAGEPAVVGDLSVVEGNYRFLGTLFQVERGVVTFYGDFDSDPHLDLELVSRAAGTVYRIRMTGQALAPTLTLGSEPAMTDGDIVSSLLFGKPLDQLDSGQETLLKARTAQVLTGLGATQVSDRLSRLVGADMVTYNPAAAEDAEDSLLIGKYLSPRLLLKYEQFLGRSTSYTVRLDYALTRLFRLETTVGQGEESGVELKWARDY